MARARRHHRVLGLLAFGLAALIAELLGRSLTHRVDVGRHVATPSYAGADYYPFLLAGVKIGVALLLARLAWRFAKARATARAGRRLLAAVGSRRGPRAPRVRIELSARLWLCTFVLTAAIYLLQTDAEAALTGSWPLLAPWLHTSALPVFAVLSVFVAAAYEAVAQWLRDYETYARATAEFASRLALPQPPKPEHASERESGPRGLFGLAFESRPPPAPA